MFTSADKRLLILLKREDSCGREIEKIKNMNRDLIIILTFTATNASKLRKTLNLLLLMRSRK
jgi:hypothetical protein